MSDNIPKHLREKDGERFLFKHPGLAGPFASQAFPNRQAAAEAYFNIFPEMTGGMTYKVLLKQGDRFIANLKSGVHFDLRNLEGSVIMSGEDRANSYIKHDLNMLTRAR